MQANRSIARGQCREAVMPDFDEVALCLTPKLKADELAHTKRFRQPATVGMFCQRRYPPDLLRRHL
jgi:hypothetical protein